MPPKLHCYGQDSHEPTNQGMQLCQVCDSPHHVTTCECQQKTCPYKSVEKECEDIVL